MISLNTTVKTLCFPVVVLVISALPVIAESETKEIKVVYHLDDARSGRFALNIAEDQLDTNSRIRIAMVAYGAGVDFLLEGAADKDGKSYAPAVQELLDRGVQFKVCSATLRFRDIPEDRVLEGMQFVPAGTYEVIRLQAEEGYVYLKP